MSDYEKIQTELNSKDGLSLNQMYFWKAIDAKGTINEIDIDDVEHSFNEIDKPSLKQFILHGPDFRLWFNPRTGEFFFNADKICQLNEYYNLPVNYGEGLIQYKQGAERLIQKGVDLGDGKERKISRLIKDIIEAHYMGYKFTYDGRKVQILFRIIPDDPKTQIPFDTKVDVQVQVTNLTTDEKQEFYYKVVG